MANKEAKARIKINKLLEQAGWRFFDDEDGPANIQLELHTKIAQQQLDALGEDFQVVKSGYVDFLLLNKKGHPLIVLEAKSEDKNPLVGKEQGRKYAKANNCRFVILSNGNLHYFWDLERGNPYLITQFPQPDSVEVCHAYKPNPERLIGEPVERDYIALTQFPAYRDAAAWKSEAERPQFIKSNQLRFLRDYQVRAVQAIQRGVQAGHDRFLFEMATGTGKTLTAAAVIKLFLRTGNAHRVLFLVDRLELEDQAFKAFIALLKNDYKVVIYKENREDWRKADVVVTTVQSLLFNNKFRRLFSPTDFDLIISDEAHRSIGGNARAVFDYFVSYKLGLTATPKDYLKKFDQANARDPRELERRILMDTYRTFGCEDGQPTFRYSLLDGVRDGFLINPTVVDARTDVTTQLLSEKGYAVAVPADDDQTAEQTFFQRDFEKKFFSPDTNRVLCQTFLANALRDPISGEIGKSIVFAVSQNHAANLVQLLNKMADVLFPGQYHSDFAVQVTSDVDGAQQFAIAFSDKSNNLCGSANVQSDYKTSKARVCVTVGMMTTGYDCTDLLNLCLMRPIFSPTDFIQIKGRGTRTHDFSDQLTDPERAAQLGRVQKTSFKLFDFFANCEYFEDKFNYDEVLKLPRLAEHGTGEGEWQPTVTLADFESFDPDRLRALKETLIGPEGMKIDRMFFDKFVERVKADDYLKANVQQGQWERAIEYVNANVLDKPEEFFTLDKLRRAAGVDRRLSLRELLECAFGLIPSQFKSKDELLEEEFAKFIADARPTSADAIVPLKYFFKAYITDSRVRDIIEHMRLTELYTASAFTMQDYRAVPDEWRARVPEYVKDYVPLNQFIA